MPVGHFLCDGIILSAIRVLTQQIFIEDPSGTVLGARELAVSKRRKNPSSRSWQTRRGEGKEGEEKKGGEGEEGGGKGRGEGKPGSWSDTPAGMSTPSIRILASKYHFPRKGTRTPWRSGSFQGRGRESPKGVWKIF